jgi:predicted nucleotide-binding protein (sugar kinase/HSP70/actin superfamily)
MYGHVAHLAGTCDFVFMPVYLETRVKPKDSEENFCYYTQFSTSLVYMEGEQVSKKLITPMLNFQKSNEYNARQLISSLHKIGFTQLNTGDLISALVKAGEDEAAMKQKLVSLFSDNHNPDNDVSVVLLGRPYVVLSETLNKGIPDIFTGMDIRAWYQDMLPIDQQGSEKLTSLLSKVPWHFAADILRASEFVARTKMLYPVLITAFKCAPDSFIIEYFKQLMHLFKKPYLIIQIDEHDSNEGYQTRIEAAIRSFRNHAASGDSDPEPDMETLLPRVETKLNNKILLMPNWDMFVSPLVVANLQRAGIDARILETNEMSIRKSMVHNTGQCLPISIIAQDYIEYIEKHDLDPSKVILWMMESKLTCNLRQYPFYIKRILENYGKGLEKAHPPGAVGRANLLRLFCLYAGRTIQESGLPDQAL